MNLQYRGVKHNAQVATIFTETGNVIGKYRGVALHAQAVKPSHNA
ncbi:MAG: DUF4278 domain-containing protein [Kaiparowitsia implicata GSE-PSE-MK54-09C]|jgi:hypothetical protein|nr:DUF4278 domain-containing protein [Kaiparowitsia implicata GSE-PSE-MK54-09C]